MEENLEVSFCDLCNSSIAEKDVHDGRLLRLHGKVLGPCCIDAVASRAALGVAGSSAETLRPETLGSEAQRPETRAATPGSADGRLLPVALVLLAAIAAATIFLDVRLGEESQAARTDREGLAREVADQQARFAALEERVAANASASELVALRTDLGVGRTSSEKREAMLIQRMDQHMIAVEGLNRQFEALKAGLPDHSSALATLSSSLTSVRQAVDDLLSRPVAEAEVRPVGRGDEILPVAGVGPEDEARRDVALHVAKLGDPDPGTRFVAVDELLRTTNADVLQYLLPMVRDDDAFVRRLTVEGLASFNSPDAVDALLSAMADDEEIVRSTAYDSVKALTGQAMPFDPAGTRDSRGGALRRWQQWWDKNRAGF